MFRPICLFIGCVLGCLPVPPAPSGGESAFSRKALYRKFWPLLAEVGLTGIACFLARLLFRRAGGLPFLWAGLGVLLGRILPFQKGWKGGAAAVCAFEIFYAPVWGILSCAAGVAVWLRTGHEVLGALLSAALFALPADLFYGAEVGMLALAVLLLLAFHRRRDVTLLIEGEDTSEDREE